MGIMSSDDGNTVSPIKQSELGWAMEGMNSLSVNAYKEIIISSYSDVLLTKQFQCLLYHRRSIFYPHVNCRISLAFYWYFSVLVLLHLSGECSGELEIIVMKLNSNPWIDAVSS